MPYADAMTNGATARWDLGFGELCELADSLVCETIAAADSYVGLDEVMTAIIDSIIEHAYENLVHLIRRILRL